MIAVTRKLVLAILISIMCSATAQAVLLTERTSFDAMMDSVITDDYSDSGYGWTMAASDFSAVLGETEYSVSSGASIALNGFYANPQYSELCIECIGSLVLDFTTTSIGNSSGVYGVAFDYYYGPDPDALFFPGLDFLALVTFGDGSTETIELTPGTPNIDNWLFFGIASERLISSISLDLGEGQSTNALYVGMDNLSIGAMAVAEPGSVAGLVLLVLTLFRLKRYRSL